jgi:type VI secretion system secreted protein Hcp
VAIQAYLSVKGRTQGQFKSETLKAGRRDKWMTVLSIGMDLQTPIDPATGHASGKRQWRPVTIVKEWGAASPQGLAACATNEDLTEVRIEFVKLRPTGIEEVYQAITLTDALLAEVRRFVAGDIAQPAANLLLEEWSFTFRNIEVKDNDGGTSFEDTFSTVT